MVGIMFFGFVLLVVALSPPTEGATCNAPVDIIFAMDGVEFETTTDEINAQKALVTELITNKLTGGGNAQFALMQNNDNSKTVNFINSATVLSTGIPAIAANSAARSTQDILTNAASVFGTSSRTTVPNVLLILAKDAELELGGYAKTLIDNTGVVILTIGFNMSTNGYYNLGPIAGCTYNRLSVADHAGLQDPSFADQITALICAAANGECSLNNPCQNQASCCDTQDFHATVAQQSCECLSVYRGVNCSERVSILGDTVAYPLGDGVGQSQAHINIYNGDITYGAFLRTFNVDGTAFPFFNTGNTVASVKYVNLGSVIDPSTSPSSQLTGGQSGVFVIDHRIMLSHPLASIHYLQTDNVNLTNKATADVRTRYPSASNFNATRVLIVTLYKVSLVTARETDETYQVVFATDETTTYGIFNYINMTAGGRIDLSSTTCSDVITLKRFNSGAEIDTFSNVGTPGRQVYCFDATCASIANGINVTCVDNGITEAFCNEGFHGTYCSICDQCLSNPCDNGGECFCNSTGDFYCNCTSGFSGFDCTVCDACANGVCGNGSCSCDNNGDLICTCDPGFAGKNCSQGKSVKILNLCEVRKSCQCSSLPLINDVDRIEMVIGIGGNDDATNSSLVLIQKWDKITVEQICKGAKCDLAALQNSVNEIATDANNIINMKDTATSSRTLLRKIIDCHSNVGTRDTLFETYQNITSSIVALTNVKQDLNIKTGILEGEKTRCMNRSWLRSVLEGVWHKTT